MAELTQEQIDILAVKFKEVLAEEDAQVYERNETVYASLAGDAEIWRVWLKLPPDDIPDAIDYLNSVTSVKNDSPMKYVDDPMVGNGEVVAGRWRQAFVKRVVTGDITKMVQCLRKGYAQEIKWDEARIKQTRLLQAQSTYDTDGIYQTVPVASDAYNTTPAEKYLEIYWPNCDANKLDELATSMDASTFTDPIICGEKRTGVWRNLVAGTSKADDGSGIVSLSIAISHFRLDGFATWLTHRTENIAYLWGYSKDESQAVANAWRAKGRSCTFQYQKESGLVDIILRDRDYDPLTIGTVTSSWNCRYKEVSDYYFGVSDPTLYLLTTIPANGISYDRQLRDNGDGSWDIIVITKNVQYRDIPLVDSSYDAVSFVQTRQQLGLTTQTPESVVSTTGKIITQRAEVRDDCSKDYITNIETGLSQSSTIKSISPSGVSITTTKTVQSAALGIPTSEKGHIKRNEDKASKYPSRFDTLEQDVTPYDQSSTSYDMSHSGLATKVIHTENPNLLTKPSLTQGVIITQESQPTEAGYERTIVVERTSYPMSDNFASLRSGAEGRDVSAYRNMRGILNASLSSQGRVFNAENNLNDDYTYDGRLTESYSYPRNISFYSTRSGEEDVYTTEYKANRDIIDAPENSQGVVFQAENNLNDDDTYGAVLRKRTSIPSSIATDIFLTHLRSGSETVQKNVLSIPTPANQRGLTEQYSGRLNEDDTYDLNLRKIFAWPDQVKFTSLISPAGSVEISSYVNKQTPITAGISSINIGSYRVTNDENDDGTYDGDIVYAQPPASARQFAFDSLKSPLLEREQTSYQFAREKIEAPSATIGHSFSASNNLTDDGTYDQDLTYNLGVLHETPLVTVGFSDSTIDYEINGKNFLSIPTITDESADYKIVKLSVGVNDLGAYDYAVNKTFVRPKPISAMTTASWDTYDSGYSWELWSTITGQRTQAWRRMHSYTVTYHRDETSAITAITGGFKESHHEKIADFLWKAVKEEVTDYVQVYPVV